MSLDRCVPIQRVTKTDGDGGPPGSNCATSGPDPSCSTEVVPIGTCFPPTDPPPDAPKCVNDNVSRPWPSPPPAEIGCNPVSLQVTNTAPAEDDPDQTIRLEGDVSYISGDACLPQVNLNLVVPATVATGGGTPSTSGFGYTAYQGCVRVGPGNLGQYKTPQDFYGNEPGAAAFVPKSTGEMGMNPCEDPCTARSRYGAQVAKFNLIGPLLAEIQSSEPITYHTIGGTGSFGGGGTQIPTGWKYQWVPSVCVTAANYCMPLCPEGSWTQYDTGFQYQQAYNNKENVYQKMLTPGVDLDDMLSKGYKPQPIMPGTQVLMYGYIPWGVRKEFNQNTQKYEALPNQDACECEMIWFFSEQNAFDGDCANNSTTQGVNPSMMPSRTVNSAGMFFGSPNNANRV